MAFYAILATMKKNGLDTNDQKGESPKPPDDILSTISFAQQNETLRTMDPQSAVLEYLEKLPERERQVLEWRHGLVDGKSSTLEEIGAKLKLTRERIRQIEKDGIKKLREMPMPENFRRVSDLMFQFIEDRGNAAGEQQILAAILAERGNTASRQSLLFVLHASSLFRLLKDSDKYRQSWYLTGLDLDFLDTVADTAVKILQEGNKSLPIELLAEKLRSSLASPELAALSNEAIESYLNISKKMRVTFSVSLK